MTPKEKAKELVDRYFKLLNYEFGDLVYSLYDKQPHQCALIAVDEILESEPRYPSDVDWDDVGGTHQYYYEAQREYAEIFWKEVKKEIEKL